MGQAWDWGQSADWGSQDLWVRLSSLRPSSLSFLASKMGVIVPIVPPYCEDEIRKRG